jgi:hypothetical protein
MDFFHSAARGLLLLFSLGAWNGASIGTLLDSISQHPIYGFAAAGGLLLGGFYGLDGWRGSLKEVDLRNSPRVKNFLWLIGAGAAAFIADIHLIDQRADKSILLLLYGICAAVGIVSVVAFFAALTLLSARHNPSAYGLGDSLGDYLQFGYHYFRKRKDELTHELHVVQGDHQRLLKYLKQLTSSIVIAGADVTLADKNVLARQLLLAVNEVVAASQPETVATIRANFMRVVPCTDEIRATVRFADDEDDLAECLELALYDSGVEPLGFRLPLIPEKVLPGAPTALQRSSPIIVDNTAKIAYPDNISQSVRRASRSYFESQPFKSFASLPVVANGRAIGVVNVESTGLEIFGSTLAEKQLLAAYLMPFCAALGVLLEG